LPVRDRFEDSQHRWPDLLLRRASALGGNDARPPGGAREVEQVRALGIVELQRSRERLEHAVRHAAGVAALQALVVLDADAGQRGDLLAAQPFHAARTIGWQPDLLWRDSGAAA
jgi:hypothetical protein